MCAYNLSSSRAIVWGVTHEEGAMAVYTAAGAKLKATGAHTRTHARTHAHTHIFGN